jgi:hypothetical protein
MRGSWRLLVLVSVAFVNWDCATSQERNDALARKMELAAAKKGAMPRSSEGAPVAQIPRLGLEIWVRQNEAPKVVVLRVAVGSSAEAAGVLSGDGLMQAGGEVVNSAADLKQIVNRCVSGTSIPLVLNALPPAKAGDTRTVNVTISDTSTGAFRNPPGWENARECQMVIVGGTNANGGYLAGGWVPGQGCCAKTVFVPSPEGTTACLNCIVWGYFGVIVHPEMFVGEQLVPGFPDNPAQRIELAPFIRAGRPSLETKLASQTIYVLPDILYVGSEYSGAHRQGVSVKKRRLFTVEVHREPPGAGSFPQQSLLLGERDGIIDSGSDWTWRDPSSVILFADGRLWHPEWKVEDSRLVSIEFRHRPLTAADAFKLAPFDGVAPAELTSALIRWKNTEFDPVLREEKTADLREYSAVIEQTVLDANSASEREKDEAQRVIEKGQQGADIHSDRSRAWRARIEVLKPILAAIKEEVANRGK